MSLISQISKAKVPILDLTPAKIVNLTQTAHCPILLTDKGVNIAVMQTITDYEAIEEERAFLKAVSKGLIDIKEGRETDLEAVKKKLGLSE